MKNKPRKWALVAFLSALFVFAPIAGIEAVQNAIPMVAAEEAVAEETAVQNGVAKVGDTEYATIDEAIANWTNGTTLTLLSDVTLSDVIQLSSTEYHILDLGTYTMTAASGKDAIQYVVNGRTSASYALDIKADATNPGGITATGKTVVSHIKPSSNAPTKDRPITRFYGGVFNASYVVKQGGTSSWGFLTSGYTGASAPYFQFYGGEYNGTIYTNRSQNQFYGGVFNGSMQMSVDSSAYTQVAGGTFKNLSNSMGSTLNSDKFVIGTAKGANNGSVCIDENGNYVVTTTTPTAAEASVASNYNSNNYFYYSTVNTNGMYYEDVYDALEANATGTVTVFTEELDLEGSSFKGIIVVPEGKTITIITAADENPTWTVSAAEGSSVTYTDKIGNELVKAENGSFVEKLVEVATYDELVTALADGGKIKLTADITVDTKITAIDGTTIDLNSKTLYVNVENSYYNNVTIKNGNIVLGKDDVHVCDGYFLVNEGKALVVDGVKISSSEEGIKGYAVFHLKTGANLELINSELNISDNEYSAGYIVYAGEATATVDVVDTTVTGSKVNGIVHATTVIENSIFTITNAIEHGINRSGVTITNSEVAISGGTGRGITAQHGPLVIDGSSKVTITDMGEATIELRNNQNLTIAETATVTLDAAVNNTTSGTITGTVILPPMGNNFNGYIGTDAIWGEVWGNARESFVIKVLDANGNVMGTTSLNNIDGILDGDVNVTWSLKLDAASNTDEYWTMEWTTAPTADNIPASVELWVDGVKVSGGNVVLSGPDDIQKIYAATADENGKILAFHTNVQEAIVAAQAGDEIVLLADVAEDVTVPAGVIFNGNGKQVGVITAAGEITFKGYTKAANFGTKYTNTTINIGEGACLETTSGRLVIGYGCTFNITGTITDAKTADKANIQPSLIVAGASFTGTNLTFNVNNAYVKFNSNSTSKNSNANGTFNFNVNNSIWDQTGVLAFYVPTSGMDPTFNLTLKDSVLTTTSHLVFSVTKGEIVIDNSNVNVGTSRQLENRSTMTIKNGSVVNGAVATSSNAINPGTIIVEDATYAVTGQFSGAAEGTGTLVIKKDATVSVGSIVDKANVVIDATDMTADDEVNFTGNLSKFTGEIEVVNNDKLEGKIVDGKIVLAVKPVASIGDNTYTTVAEAIAAAQNGDTITLFAGEFAPINISNKNITIQGTVGADGELLTTIKGGNPAITAHGFNGTIKDLKVVDAFKVMYAEAAGSVTVDNIYVTGATYGLHLVAYSEGLTWKIENSYMDLAWANSFGVYGGGDAAIVIKGNEFVSTNPYYPNYGALPVNTFLPNVTVEGNVFGENTKINIAASITDTSKINISKNYHADGVNNAFVEDSGVKTPILEYYADKDMTQLVKRYVQIGENYYETLAEAVEAAQAGDEIVLLADIDYGTDQLKIEKAITLDLGGNTLTTRNAYGGISVKNNPTIKNGTIVHASNTAAIKVWNAVAFEDLVIDVQGKGDANKTIGGIVLQSSTTTRVDSIKNVIIKGAALTNGIETYNCGDATENVIGFMENVTINANGTGMIISAPCGTATGCTISGGNNAIEIFVKGTYSASLDLVDCDVEGGIFAHDEFSDKPDIVNNGTLNFTADAATTGVDDVTLTLARAENVEGILKDIKDNAQATVNNTYYATLADAMEAVAEGGEIKLLQNVGTSEKLTITKSITLNGNGKKITYTGSDRAIDIPANENAKVNVTISNLTVDCTASYCQRGINYNDDGALTLTNVTIMGTNVTYALNLPGSSDNATVTITDSDIAGNIALNVWGENVTINATNTIFTSVDNNEVEGYGVVKLNNDGTTAAEGTVINITGGEIRRTGSAIGDTEAVSNATLTGVINISDSTEVDGEIVEMVAIISYGDTFYSFLNLADAIAKAQAGETIKLLRDVTMSEILVINKKITLDGNGKTLTSSAGRAINVSGANGATIKNLTIKASGERAINVIQNATNVTIENVTATAANYTVNLAASAANAVVTIKNSNLTGLNVVNVGAAGAMITVDGTVVNCNDQSDVEKYAALCLNKDAKETTIAATNVTFNVKGDSHKARNGAEGGVITIDGSTKDVAVVVAYIATNTDYYYDYLTLADAVEAAKAGETITLLSDVQLFEILTIDKAITIDTNDYTLRAEFVLANSNVTLTAPEGLEVTTIAGYYVVYEDGVYVAKRETKFQYVNLSVGVDLSVNFYVSGEAEIGSGVMNFSMLDLKGTEMTSSSEPTEVTINGQTMWKFTFKGVGPHLMGKQLTATLVVEGITTEYKYSIQEYAMKELSRTAEDLGYTAEQFRVYREFLVNLLNYGAESQKYMDLQDAELTIPESELVTADLTEEQKKLITNYHAVEPNAEPDVKPEGVIVGKVVILGSKNKIEILLQDATGAANNATKFEGWYVKVYGNGYRGTKFDIAQSGNYAKYYSVILEDILVTEYDNNYDFFIYNAAGEEVGVVSYSIQTYVYKTQDTTKDAAALTRALWNYYHAAEDYIDEF